MYMRAAVEAARADATGTSHSARKRGLPTGDDGDSPTQPARVRPRSRGGRRGEQAAKAEGEEPSEPRPRGRSRQPRTQEEAHRTQRQKDEDTRPHDRGTTREEDATRGADEAGSGRQAEITMKVGVPGKTEGAVDMLQRL
eukprot:1444658-Pleurochrysis_carterae.AAC.1